MHKTKIVATIGPASDSVETLANLITSGVSVFRFNLKHNTHDWHSERIARVKEASIRAGKPAAILLDLQGPEIRTGSVDGGAMKLETGSIVRFVLDKRVEPTDIILPNQALLRALSTGMAIAIDDGRLRLKIIESTDSIVRAEVLLGGVLKDHKSVNIPDLPIELPAVVEKDIHDLSLAARGDVDYVALSFVRSAKDVIDLKAEMEKQGVRCGMIAKIETGKALGNFDEILAVADGIMVARGDLGVELPVEQVPYFQKKIIRRCVEVGKPVITATEMLESMIEHPYPTRAEVSDVANAVYDLTDAVMLSAESAAGKYPMEAVETLNKTTAFIDSVRQKPSVNYVYDCQSASLSGAAYGLVENLGTSEKDGIAAFVVLTESGQSARFLSRYRPNIPIIAVTREAWVRDRMLLYYGVTPVHIPFEIDAQKSSPDNEIAMILQEIKKRELLAEGSRVVMLYGDHWGIPGNTNVLRIHTI